MPVTWIELSIAPALVGAASLVARRWGPSLGGLVSAFPAVVGPVLLIAATEHGASFAARTANGTLLGLVSLSAFALGYGRIAPRAGWRLSIAFGWSCAGLAALGAGLLAVGAPGGLLLAAASLWLAHRGLPRDRGLVAERAWPRGELALRMALTAILVVALTLISRWLGPTVGGLAAALPVVASLLAGFTHRSGGAPAAVALLRGMVAGMAGFVAFCELVAVLIVPAG